jgi:sulfur carrier protein ThiS
LTFTRNLQRFVECPPCQVEGETVREALQAYCAERPGVWDYVVDNQGAVRNHVAVFVNRASLIDRRHQSDPVGPDDEIYVMQALSGGC